MKKKTSKKAGKRKIVRKVVESKPSMLLGVTVLILNTRIWPGLGTLFSGRIKIGAIQLVSCLTGFILGILGFVFALINPILGLVLAMLGSVMIVAAWVWALVTSIIIVRKASE